MSTIPASIRRRRAEAAEPPLRGLPTAVAARRLLLSYLEKAEKAAGRLVASADPKALHDFRVALRRFRAAERAYRPWLGEAVPKKLRRRLREVVQLSGPARDGEVQLAWLHAQQAHLRGSQAGGWRWMLHRLELRQHDAEQQLREALPAEFTALAARLGAALRQRSVVGEDQFARATGERLQPLLAELGLHLSALSRIDAARHVHPARLICKRIRYLLEPLGETVSPAELVQLQELLGDVNDAAVLGDTLAAAAAEAGAAQVRARLDSCLRPGGLAARSDPRPGLLALAQRLADQQRQGMELLQQRHAQGDDDKLLGRLGTVVEGLLGEAAGAATAAPA